MCQTGHAIPAFFGDLQTRGLGFTTEGITGTEFENGGVVFFDHTAASNSSYGRVKILQLIQDFSFKLVDRLSYPLVTMCHRGMRWKQSWDKRKKPALELLNLLQTSFMVAALVTLWTLTGIYGKWYSILKFCQSNEVNRCCGCCVTN